MEETSYSKNDYTASIKKRFRNFTRIFLKRERVDDYNKESLSSSGHSVAFIPAQRNNRCSYKIPTTSFK